MLEQLMDAGEIDFVSMDVKAPLDPFSYRRTVGGARRHRSYSQVD